MRIACGDLVAMSARVLERARLQLRVRHGLVDRAPALGVVRRVLAGQEEDLASALVAHLPREQRGAVARVERADVGVGLLEPRVLAARQGKVGDHVQLVAAAGRPAVDRRDGHLGRRAHEALHLEDVQPAAIRGRIGGGALVEVAVAAANALVAAGTERVHAVRRRSVAGDDDRGDVNGLASVVERAVQLVDRLGAERVAHLRPIERDAHGRQVASPRPQTG